MSEIRQWLAAHALDRYADAFEREEITLSNLPDLVESDLKDLGLPLGPRKTILRIAHELRPSQDVSPPAGDMQPGAATANVERQGERRHLTVMFCDLVGSTKLSQQLDPEALRELMRAYQETCGKAIDKYDGHVAQYLGDGLMTYFGWPRAHEDDAERAIRAGLDIVEAVKHVTAPEPLRVRVGIATGPVVVGETGNGDASVPKLAVGETPNVAARIQGHAEADQIIIGPDTRRLIGGTFDLDDFGEHTFKGIIEPVHTWRVTGLAASEGRFDAAHRQAQLTPLVGREQELGLLMERWQLAQGGEGQVVLLCGEPGIGKSRILRALRNKLESKGAKPMRFQCSPYYNNSAFWPSIDNFERALRFARDETPESKLDKLESLIVGYYGRPQSDVRFIAAMLSIPCEERYGELAMTPQKFKDETLRTLVDLTEAAANKQPSVMLFEDLHWADPTTLEVLDLMIDRVKDVPLLIVLTHRPEFQNRWSDHGHVIGLNLSKLTRAQSAAMVSKVVGDKSLPDDLLEQIIAKTDGVPLFVEELTKSILESGELADAGDHYEYAGKSHSVTIPATLRDSLMARLDRFMPVKQIAQIGAAIGREFSYELVSAVAPLSKNQLDVGLAQLTDSGLAFRRGTPPDAVYTFKHALVQDAAYDSLLKSKRQELHGKIARVIEERFPETKTTEPEVLAHHLTAANLSEAAIPLWKKAGELALKRMAVNEAIAHLTSGLTLTESLVPSRARDAHELELRAVLGAAWLAAGGWAHPHVWSSYSPALNLARSLDRRDLLSPILWGLWANVVSNGRAAESVQWAEQMLASAKDGNDRALEVSARISMMVSSFWLGNFASAQEHGEAVSALYDEKEHGWIVGATNNDPVTLVGLFGSHWTWMRGFPDRARQLCVTKDARALDLGHAFNLGFALGFGSWVFAYRGEPEELLRRADQCEKVGRDNGLIFLVEMQAAFTRARVLLLTGKLEEGVAMLERYFRSPMCLPVSHPYSLAVQAEALALLRRDHEALERANEAIEQIERPGWGERSHYAEVLRIKGRILAIRGDFENAEKNYLASIDWARKQQAKSWELRTSTSLARLWQSQGKKQEAHHLLAPVYDWFTEGFDTKDLRDAKTLLGELAE